MNNYAAYGQLLARAMQMLPKRSEILSGHGSEEDLAAIASISQELMSKMHVALPEQRQIALQMTSLMLKDLQTADMHSLPIHAAISGAEFTENGRTLTSKIKFASWNCLENMQNPMEFYSSTWDGTPLGEINEKMMNYLKTMTNSSIATKEFKNKGKEYAKADRGWKRPFSFYGTKFDEYCDCLTDLIDISNEHRLISVFNHHFKNYNDPPNEKTSAQIELVKQHDYIIFKTIHDLLNNHKIKSFKEMVKKILLAYQPHKMAEIQAEIIRQNHIGIICIQECSQHLKDKLTMEGYRIFPKDSPTCIACLEGYSEPKVIKMDEKLFMFEFGRFAVICAHLDSNNPMTVSPNFEDVMRHAAPSSKPILVGMDTNIKEASDRKQALNLARTNNLVLARHVVDNKPTVKKKRSALQYQLHKAFEEDVACKDYIMAKNFKYPPQTLESTVVPAADMYLPSPEFPSDHKMVMVEVEL